MKIQACLGAATWAALSLLYSMGNIEILLSFAFLVLVPLTLLLTNTVTVEGKPFKSLKLVSICHYPFAVLGTFSVIYEPGMLAGFLAVGWFLYTFMLAGYGVVRLLARGWKPLDEALIDIAFIYVVLGGVWLVLHRFDVEGLPFPSVIVLLTAIHFHYSAFLVPIFTGMLGRYLYTEKIKWPGFPIVAIGVISGPMVVAAGINFGGVLEYMAVVLYVLVLYWLGIGTIIVMLKGKGASFGRLAVIISSLALLGTMSLSYLYSYGNTFGPVILTIPDMVIFHGVGNAFGYGLLGVLGWIFLAPPSRDNYYSFPVSKLRGKKYVGSSYMDKYKVRENPPAVRGLVDSFAMFENDKFHPQKVDFRIRRFYEDTQPFRLIAKTSWRRGFRFLSRVYHELTGRFGQLHLEPHRDVVRKQEMVGAVFPILDVADGREAPRVWLREDKETGETIFVAVYSYHVYNGKRYMNIALPLPWSVMTGILRPDNDEENGLLLTSEKIADEKGHEGIYLTVGQGITVRLPISETFHIQVVDGSSGRLRATHKMKICGIPCLELEYEIFEQR